MGVDVEVLWPALRDFAERISGLTEREADDALWEMLECLQGCVFRTSKGLKFQYAIRGGEIFIDRRERSKSLTRSTVLLAFRRAREIQRDEGCVSGPKKLGTFGASYLYSIFLSLRICTLPQKERSKKQR